MAVSMVSDPESEQARGAGGEPSDAQEQLPLTMETAILVKSHLKK